MDDCMQALKVAPPPPPPVPSVHPCVNTPIINSSSEAEPPILVLLVAMYH